MAIALAQLNRAETILPVSKRTQESQLDRSSLAHCAFLAIDRDPAIQMAQHLGEQVFDRLDRLERLVVGLDAGNCEYNCFMEEASGLAFEIRSLLNSLDQSVVAEIEQRRDQLLAVLL